MRIVFVNPQWMHEKYFGRFDEARSLQQPLGIAYLAAVLETDGHRIRIIDAAAQGYLEDDVMNEIKSFAPDLVGISSTTASFSRALALAGDIKRQLGLTVILGGPHVSALPEETIGNSCFDIGVLGEGELTICEIAETLEHGGDIRKVPGIICRKHGIVHRGPRRTFIENLDSLPFPARHLLPPLDAYRPTASAYKRIPQATMITSRGCPYKCTFCDRSVFGNTYRARSAKNVVDEMELLLAKHGAKEIRFWDDTFNIDTNRVMEICREMQTREISVPWTCLARMNHMNREVLQAMAKSGCWQVDYGIESGNQQVLNRIGKGLTLEMMRKVTRMTHKAGIKMRGFFMLGLPGETEHTMRDTIQFAKELDLSAAVFHITTPFPGTELYEEVVESGELDPNIDWDNYSLFSSETGPYVPKELTRETISDYKVRAYREFYFRLSYVLRQVLGIRGISDIRRYMTGFSVLRKLD